MECRAVKEHVCIQRRCSGIHREGKAPGPCSCTFDCACLFAGDLNSTSYTSQLFRNEFRAGDIKQQTIENQLTFCTSHIHIIPTAVTNHNLALGDNGLAKEIFHKFRAFQTRARTLSLKAFEQNELQFSTLEQVSWTNGSGTCVAV